jgi:hypothetical protein
METVAAPAARVDTRRGRLETIALALLAFVPFLFSSPGRVAADTKTYLYLDPGRLLERAPYLWDTHNGFGTVPHQQVGYLFPMGPYFWLMDTIGLPAWIAQRLWLGTISFAAVLGARWLFRRLGVRPRGALAGALVYMLTPYQLAFTARISVILLAWAALPWLVGLAMRAVRDGGWRDPALFALVCLAAGSVSASGFLFVLVGPALWLVVAACGARDAVRASVGAGLRIAVLTAGVLLWSAVGLRMQGSYGLPVLQLTESLRTVANASDPTDILRGIGNWFFYGRDHLGYSIDQASDYLHDGVVVVATFAIPVLALAAAGIVRWRHRAYFVLLLAVGTLIAVGAWPYADPSPYGALFKVFNETSAGLALRNTPRAVPLIVLALAGLLAAAVSALAARRREVLAAGVVIALALLAFLPVWRYGYLSGGVERDEELPDYWTRAATAIDRRGDETRVLEVPGSAFAAYRWGDTIEPITPGITDRPYVAREVLPSGAPQSVDFLDALDHRIQEGTLEPHSLAPYARLGGIGTIVLRSDLQYTRFDTPRPRLLWELFTKPLPDGLQAPLVFGARTRNEGGARVVDNVDLRIPTGAEDPPPVALFDVEDPVPIVHTAPSAQPVLMSGDGEGIVDLAAAGLVDGNQLLLQSATLDRRALGRVLRDGADLVLTDSNRRRSQHYFSRILYTTGYTERAGETGTHGDDTFRLDTFPGSNDASRTVVEQHGGTVWATDYALSVDRPANAVDGDPRTAWRVGARAEGEKLSIRPAEPVRTDRVTIAQLPVPLENPDERVIEQVRLHFDDGDTLDVALGPESRTAAGQVVTFPMRDVRELTVEITDVLVPAASRGFGVVGLSEVGIGDLEITETVRLPVDLADRVGDRADGHRLDVVLSRLRVDPGTLQDEELALARRFVLPDARSFALTGTARVDPNAPDSTIDDVLGTLAPGTTYSASDHLAGDFDARASRAFDGDLTTAWSPGMGPQRGRWIAVALPAPVTVDHLDVTYIDDADHSVPRQFTLAVDGVPARSFTVDPARAEGTGRTRRVTIPIEPVTGRDFRLYVDYVDGRFVRTEADRPGVVAPVGLAEVGIAGTPVPAAPTRVPDECRDDLLTVNGTVVPARVVGAVADARRGLALEACRDALDLAAGSNTLRSGMGLDTGIDVDRVVLSSDADGDAVPPTVLGTPLDESGASVHVVSANPVSRDLRVRTDGTPFWLVFGESANEGWEADVGGGRAGPRQVVNGFANGWLVTPARAGTMDISLQWTPQRYVWFGFAVSALVVLACVVLAVRGRRRPRGPDDLADPPRLTSPFRALGTSPSAAALVALALGAGVVTALGSRPWVGVVVGLACVLVARVADARIVFTAGAPVALALARISRFDDFAWLAVALVVADLATGWVRSRSRPERTDGTTPAAQ